MSGERGKAKGDERMNNFTNPHDELLTRKEISQRLKLSERTVARWMAEGNVPHHKFGSKTVRFWWSEVRKCFEERERGFQAELEARRKGTGVRRDGER
jgi:excisionase family DNA binding protein